MRLEAGGNALQIDGEKTILRSLMLWNLLGANRKWQSSASLAKVISLCRLGLN